jgi:hypothetical protein
MLADEQELGVAYRHIRACRAARAALYQQLGDGQLFDVVARAYDTRIRGSVGHPVRDRSSMRRRNDARCGGTGLAAMGL